MKNEKAYLVENKTKEIKLVNNAIYKGNVHSSEYRQIHFSDSNTYLYNFISPEFNEIPKYYNSNFEELKDITGNIYKNHIYMPKDNTVEKYDLDGNLISTKTINDAKIYDVILNKAVVVRNNELILKDFDTEEELKIATIDYNYIEQQKYANTKHEFNSYFVYYDGNLSNYEYYIPEHGTLPCTLDNLLKEDGIFKTGDYGKKDIPNGFQILFVVNETKDINKGAYLYTITDNNDIVINTFKSGGQCF